MRLRGSTSTELAYAERTSDFVQVAVANTSYDVTSLSVPAISPGGVILVEAFLPSTKHSVAASDITLQLWEDATLLQAATLLYPTSARPAPRFIKSRAPSTPGTHTYKLVVRTPTAGTVTFTSGVGFASYIRVARA